jgi:hypothetical protein
MVKPGDRVELVYTDDPYTRLRKGDQGVVRKVVSTTVFIKWDDGSNLSLLEGEDRWKKVS